MGFSRKNSSSSTASTQNANVIWHNVGIPCPTSTVEDALLEANYAAYYQSDTYNEISAVAADLPLARPTLDPNSSEYIGHAIPKSPFKSCLPPLKTYPHPNAENAWPGTFQPESQHPAFVHARSQSDAGCECPGFEKVDLPLRSKSDAGVITETPFDLSTPWNPTFPPYSKYYIPAKKNAKIKKPELEDDGSGIGRPQAYDGTTHRLSELIDPADLLPESSDRFGSFSSVSSASYGSRSSSLSRSRSTSPASSASSSRNGSRKPSLADSIKPLPPVLESPSGTLFSASEFAAHPNRPLAIRERQEHIRAAIESLESQTRLARSESRKGSADSTASAGSGASEWKTGFGCDSRKGSKSSTASGLGGTAYGGFGVDHRPARTLEEMRIEEGRRAYAEKNARKEKGERSWGLSALRGRK